MCVHLIKIIKYPSYDFQTYNVYVSFPLWVKVLIVSSIYVPYL